MSLTIESSSFPGSNNEPQLHPQTIEEIDQLEPVVQSETEARTSHMSAVLDRVSNFFDTRAKQSEAFDSYSDNITATKERESYERREHAREVVRGFGSSAMNLLRHTGRVVASGGLTALGVGMVVGEATGRGIARSVDSALDKGVEASAFIDRKIEDAYNFYDGKKVEYGNKIENYQLNRSQAKETNDFERQTRSEKKDQLKQDKTAMRAARREDRDFEKTMKAKEKAENELILDQTIQNIRAKAQYAKERDQLVVQTNKEKDAREKTERRELKQAEKIDNRHDRILNAIKARERRAARRTAMKAAISEKYETTKASVVGNASEIKGMGQEAYRQKKRQAHMLGHTVGTFLSVAHEAGQTAVDTGAARWKAIREDERSHGEK